MNEHDALRLSACLVAGWRRVVVGSAGDQSIVWRGHEGETAETDADLPALTLDRLRELRQSFTEMQQDRYHSELCASLRPDCSCNIVGTWDMIQATVEQHAKAYIATMTKYEQPRLEKTRAHDKSTV